MLQIRVKAHCLSRVESQDLISGYSLFNIFPLPNMTTKVFRPLTNYIENAKLGEGCIIEHKYLYYY